MLKLATVKLLVSARETSISIFSLKEAEKLQSLVFVSTTCMQEHISRVDDIIL